MTTRLAVFVLVAGVLAAAFPAGAVAGAEPIGTVEIGKNREFRVNGKPFFPIMLWAQSDARINDGLGVSVNTFCSNAGSLTNKEYLDALARNGMYGVVHFDRECVGHPHLLAWIHGDEPDMPSGSGEDIHPRRPLEEVSAKYREIKEADRSRPVFVTFTAHFMSVGSKYSQEMKEKLYPAYVQSCDVAGFDTYPIFGSNHPNWLDRVAQGVTELRAFADPRPIYAWIETNKGSRWVSLDRQLDVLPIHTRAETWMAVIRGATAIGYFTHRWNPYKQFAPEGEMVVELKRLNDQITRLAPAILADPARVEIAMSLTGGLACHLKATELDGDLYIFAQNIDIDPNKDELRQGEQISPRAGKATITVAGLTAGTRIEVIDEGRTITAEDGRFTDDFGPLAEHIYRLKL